MISKLETLKFAIFDFDGTLMNLNVDWKQVRREIGVNSIEDIWSLSPSEQDVAWQLVSRFEIESVVHSTNNPDVVALTEQLDYSVLTNNCETAVEKFLLINQIQRTPEAVVGRNWLGKSKKDRSRFSEAIAYLLAIGASDVKYKNFQLGYFGDSDYELEYSLSLGLSTFRVDKQGCIEPFRRQEE